MSSDQPGIVVLDGFALNPGDLSWEKLQSLGDCTIYDRTPTSEVVQRAQEAQIVLTNKAVLSRETIGALPKLKYIGVVATGYNVVDVVAAREQGIPVTNVPIYGTQSVAQMVFAHLLNLTQHVADHSTAVGKGSWASAVDWCFWDSPLVELEGMTMGIVGLGRIGRATAQLAHAFGMQVIATSRSAVDPPDYLRIVDLDTVFRESDVVSLHCPLTPETEQLVDRDRLQMMKATAFLINTSRGPLIDEAALAVALNARTIAGAGLDVLSAEPPPENHPLVGVKNCIITPHIAWATRSSRGRLLETAVDNVAAFLAGSMRNEIPIG